MQIGTHNLDARVLIIAEIGNNHEGDLAVAERLVHEAAAAGADAVKFQTFQTEHYVGRANPERFSRLKGFELRIDQFETLAALAHSLGLLFLSTPFDLASARGLAPFVDAYKIASGDNNFFPLLGEVARTGRPVVISTGVSDTEQVRRTVGYMEAVLAAEALPKRLVLLHCVSSYPVPPEQANLRSIAFLKDRFGYPVGYSDHTLGNEAAVLSVALGARVIEKHFTLDHHYSSFRDHQLSATPEELQALVTRVRTAEAMLGRTEKAIQPCEAPLATAVRRSVVAAGDLAAGAPLAADQITWLRPAGGLAPGREEVLVGRVLRRSIRQGEPLQLADVA